MARARLKPADLLKATASHRGTLLPVFALSLILVILVPLPPGIMDLPLSANITLSAVVLLTVTYMNGPL
ncbi:MAG: hypothetical protein GY778_00875, partial [bacterium]|nr:hypothetical protein [bacterium]